MGGWILKLVGSSGCQMSVPIAIGSAHALVVSKG